MWKSSPLTPAAFDTRCVGRDNVDASCCSLSFKHTNSHSVRYRSVLSVEIYPLAAEARDESLGLFDIGKAESETEPYN